MSKNKKSKKGLVALGIVVGLIIAIFGSFFIYANDYYHASSEAIEATSNTLLVDVNENDHYYSFNPKVNLTSTGIVVYPGGKVEAVAYAPLCKELASVGIYVALVKMPLNLAMFGLNRADEVLSDNSDIKNWYLAGHSLGGAMGASYISKNVDKYKGMIFLAAYSTADLSNSNLAVLSIYGSEDKVLNKENYEKNKVNLPSNYSEVIIDGGCHSYFASYGEQKGDGTPTIERSSQVSQTVTAIKVLTYLS